MKYQKGISGNPRGRPKRGETLTDLLREKIEVPKSPREKLIRKEKLIERLITLAEGGDLAALKYIFDRIDGLPRQSIELDAAVDAKLMAIMNGQ